MRSHSILLPSIAVLAAFACSGRDTAADSAATGQPANAGAACIEGGGAASITAAGVGPLRVGGSVGDIARRCTVRDTSFTLGEGMTENGRVVSLGAASATLVVTGDAEPTIERIIVTDSSIRTEEGLGVGKTVGALRAAYGRLCTTRGEGNVVVNVAPLPGVSFAITGSIPATADVEKDPGSIPDNAAISRIWVHGGRSACGGS